MPVDTAADQGLARAEEELERAKRKVETIRLAAEEAKPSKDEEAAIAKKLRQSLDFEAGVKLKDGREVAGLVSSVAATNAFAVIDGWHIPLATVEEIL